MKIDLSLRDAESILHSRVQDCWRCLKRHTSACVIMKKERRCFTTNQYKQFIYLLRTHPHYLKLKEISKCDDEESSLESGKTTDKDSSFTL